MKQKQASSRKRPVKASAVRRTVSRRPLHKRILLHPFSVMVILCAGVLIAGSTFQGLAASYDVSASVYADLPSSPAIITDPVDTQHFSSTPIQVSGSCPPASYVKVYRDGAFSGAGLCSGTTFHIQTGLHVGANSLQAKVFNLTDNEGPASSPITVYYDQTAVVPAPPVAPPTELQIANIESGEFAQGKIVQTSVTPTISGIAPPYSDIVVTFHSDPVTCRTKADGQGWWSCTLATQLPPGTHHVEVVATTIDGRQLRFPSFEIKVIASLPTIIKKQSVQPFLIQSEYAYQAHKPGQTFSFGLGVGGGAAPFTVNVDWGDDQHTALVRGTTDNFVVTHTYERAADYPVLITITDVNGTTASLQLLAVVRSSLTPVSAVIRDESGLMAVLTELKRYLWIIWPVYIAVVLMVLSYWIGEQEAYRRLIGRKPAQSAGKSKR
jgi:hypothetical protein